MSHHFPVKQSREFSRSAITIFFIISMILGMRLPAGAADAETEKTPARVAFGVGALYGMYDLQTADTKSGDSGPGNTKFSPSFGGGLILETMFSNRFGVHTGLWYQHTVFEFYQGGVESTSENLLMPIYLLTSFHGGPFTLGLLAGIHLAYYTRIDFEMGGMSADVLKYTNSKQIGVAGGFEVKLAITRFVDIFVAAVAEKYLTALFEGGGEDTPQYVYGATVRSGVLFRTF